MLIKTLTVENLGLYRGRVEFDLQPRVRGQHERPIILFGGHNGAGKTTLLESIPLCFYGRASLGDRVKTDDYHQFLYDKIHRANSELFPSTEASIQVGFDHVVMGVAESFVVTRSWETVTGDATGIRERVEIQKDGRPLEEVDENNWEAFLRGLLPKGLTQLFFFDGEKIQRLANDNENAELSSSVRSLLGLDLVDRLETDLRVYLNRQVAATGDKAVRDALEKTRKKIEEAKKTKTAANQESMRLNSDSLDPCNKAIESLTAELQADGAVLASELEQNREALKELAVVAGQHKGQVLELARGWLPFALCPALTEELQSLLRTDVQHGFSEQLDGWLTKFVTGGLADAKAIPVATRKKVKAVLKNAVEDESRSDRAVGAEQLAVLEGWSDSDRKWALEGLSVAIEHLPTEAVSLRATMEQIAERQHQVEAKASRAPDNEALRPKYEKLQGLHEQKGQLTEQYAGLMAKVTAHEQHCDQLLREKAKLEMQLSESAETTERMVRVGAVQRALAEFKTEATKLKVAQLEQELAGRFQEVAQKDDLVEAITIDPGTWAIQLLGHDQKAIDRKQLSAGEKQILAISILWALGRTSGRPLPVMIDTPLARLDSHHRLLLLEKYFPYASHQVIVFSTDTEVDEKFFQTIRKHVSHAYNLRYDKTEERTIVRTGYYWQDERDETTDQPVKVFG